MRTACSPQREGSCEEKGNKRVKGKSGMNSNRRPWFWRLELVAATQRACGDEAAEDGRMHAKDVRKTEGRKNAGGRSAIASSNEANHGQQGGSQPYGQAG